MYPVLLRLGAFTVPTYTALIDLGLAVSLAWLYLGAPKAKAGRWLDAGLAAVFGGLAGARLVYCFANSGYYFEHPEEIFMIWQGGLDWAGAVLGGFLGAGLYCSRAREPLAPIFDLLAWPIALLSLLGWGGCLAAGCAYGAEFAPGQAPAWLAVNAPDLYGVMALRWPTQLLGLVWSLIALGAVWLAARWSWRGGARGFYALAVVALGAFGLSFLRGDPDPFTGGLRLDTLASGLVLLLALAGWVWRARKQHAV
jgi:phosphatidylglycerol---prolipoprotein diacylglyceryl transferase